MQKPSVLLIDDSAMMRRFIALFLSKKYRVTECESAEEALRSVENGLRPRLVVTDQDLPGISGLELIRNTSLDELPQLWNVVRGDMSLVGNRPLPPYEAEQLTTDDAVARFLAPAGITGLWQVTDRGKKGMSADSRKKLDADYSSRYSFLLDCWILIKTPMAALQKVDA